MNKLMLRWKVMNWKSECLWCCMMNRKTYPYDEVIDNKCECEKCSCVQTPHWICECGCEIDLPVNLENFSKFECPNCDTNILPWIEQAKSGVLLVSSEEKIENLRLKVIVLEARVNSIQARLDGDETYRMEQRERNEQ